MADSPAPGAHDSIAALTGEAFARAVTTLARGHALRPFGLARSTNGHEEQRDFAVGKDGAANVVEAAEAAFRWLEEEASRADICLIVMDGSIGEGDEDTMDAIVGRAFSLEHRLMIDLALPYEPNDDEEGFSFSEPMYRFSDLAGEARPSVNATVDPDLFDSVFRRAFMAHAPAVS